MLIHEFELLLHRFIESQTIQGFAPRTIEGRKSEVLAFLRYYQETGHVKISDLSQEFVRDYRLQLTTRETGRKGLLMTSGSICRVLSCIQTFCEFLRDRRYIYINPCEGLKRPRIGKTLPKALELEEVRTILEAPDLTTPLGMRDKAILELMYSSGLRRTEVMNLKLSETDFSQRQVYVVGKGNKEAVVPFGSRALNHLKNYIYFGRPQLLKGPHDALFVTNRGGTMGRPGFGCMISKYAKQTGIHFSAHMLRHSCATHLLKNGADIRLIQSLLRHECLNSTQIYTHLNVEDIKEAQMKYHPRELYA